MVIPNHGLHPWSSMVRPRGEDHGKHVPAEHLPQAGVPCSVSIWQGGGHQQGPCGKSLGGAQVSASPVALQGGQSLPEGRVAVAVPPVGLAVDGPAGRSLPEVDPPRGDERPVPAAVPPAFTSRTWAHPTTRLPRHPATTCVQP